MARAFIRIIAGAGAGTVVPLPENAPFIIGRKQGDLLLADSLVSGVHARIFLREDGGWQLQDLNSTNGTMVDGRLVRDIQLKPGMEVAVGHTRMILFQGPEEPKPEEKPPSPQAELDIAWLLDEDAVEIQGGDRTRSPGDVIGQDLRLPPGMNAVLEVVAGDDVGKVFRFTRGNITIGRRTGEVPLSDLEVSRRHSVIEVFGRDMIFLRDLGSTNGTYHNGKRVRVARLRSGDTVGVGRSVLKLQVNR